MCETCGCSLHPKTNQTLKKNMRFTPVVSPKNISQSDPLSVEQHNHKMLHNIMSSNDHQADHNRKMLKAHGIVCINLMSSPGSGKTTLLEHTVQSLKRQARIAVIEGDLETENDAQRIRAQGIDAIQITTGNACHLDAHYIHQALAQLDLDNIDLIFIENVGNLVCPAAFDLGQNYNIALLSSTEGDDKPLKYPIMFQKVDALILSKIELLDFFDDFSKERAEKNFRKLANHGPVWPLSAKTGCGMQAWNNWLQRQLVEAHNLHVRSRTRTNKTYEQA